MNAYSPKMLHDEDLHIDANMAASSPIDVSHDGDIHVWDGSADKMLCIDATATPKPIEPFFESNRGAFLTPTSLKHATGWTEASLRSLTQSELAAVLASHGGSHASLAHHQHQQHHQGLHTGVEPTSEPCTDEIPWSDLVYWLGNSTTGQVECHCSTCNFERTQGRVPTASAIRHAHGHYVHIPTSIYKRLSAKIPVIAMPRIEGVN